MKEFDWLGPDGQKLKKLAEYEKLEVQEAHVILARAILALSKENDGFEKQIEDILEHINEGA